MKNTTKLLNILTAFLGVIGLCTAALVCFIVIYTQITGGFSKKNTADPNIVTAQADDTDIVNADITNVDMINTDQETEILPASPEQTSEYGERFSPDAAQYAIDNMTADWNYNALQKAKNYQNTMNMSPDAIREQLTSEYGDQFTSAEADYAVSNIEN